MAKLTAKMERFCLEYVVDFNATQAAIRAGYSKKTAQQIGSENLCKPLVAARVAELANATAAKVELSAQWLRDKALETIERCSRPGELFDPAGVYRGLDFLAKHIGFFEKDNQQRAATGLQGFADLPPEARAFIAGKIRDAIEQQLAARRQLDRTADVGAAPSIKH